MVRALSGLILTSASVLMLAAAGCSKRGWRGESVAVVYDGAPLTFDPNGHREIVTRSVLSNCFEGLVGFDPQMRIVPQLAASWENPDDITWVFHLRPGVRFHNGRELGADAVIATFRSFALRSKNTGIRLGSVDTVFALDNLTLVVKTSRPDAVLLNQLTKFYIVSDTPRLRFDSDTGAVFMPAGTGPYLIGSWRNGRMSLEAWDGYWDRRPQVRSLALFFREGHRGTEELLRRGEVDIAAGINARDAARISEIPGIKLMRQPGLAVRYLRADPRAKPFSDARVRRAVSLALDRQALVDSTAAGYGRQASQMVTEAVFGFNPSLPALRHDPDSARALLAVAGYRTKGPFLLLDVLETRRGLGRLITHQLEQVGFVCSLCVHSREEFFLGAGRPSRFFLSAVASTSGDASGALSLDGRAGGALSVMNPAQRLEAMQKAMAAFTSRLEYIPLFSEDDLSAVSDRVVWQPRQDMLVLGKDISIKERGEGPIR